MGGISQVNQNVYYLVSLSVARHLVSVSRPVKIKLRFMTTFDDKDRRDRMTTTKQLEIIMEAVKQDGLALRYASEQLKNDREFVMEEVKQNWWALYYASKQLKNDREIVMEAVKQNGLALRGASEQLKNDR